jgi:hypothetical protein
MSAQKKAIVCAKRCPKRMCGKINYFISSGYGGVARFGCFAMLGVPLFYRG